MGGKKQPGRFTIQFNEADPQQRQVIELLNQQGRRKAVFLTCAVLAYCGQGSAPALPLPAIEPAIIEQIVQRALRQQAAEPLQAGKATPKAPAGLPAVTPSAQMPTPPLPLAETGLPDDDLAAICDTIDAFRQ